MAQDDNFFNESADQNPNIRKQGNSDDRATANSLGIAGLTIGIIGLLVSFIPCFGLFALFIGVIGIVLSGIGLYMANKGHFEKGILIGGLVISILATLIALLQWTIAGTALNQVDKATDEVFIEKLKEIDKEIQMKKDTLDGEIAE